jgi:pimeloyl-ACP methyl ester carboxylesterase
VFLHGQNPSGSGALHLGAKYPDRFAALVISSGPIVYGTYPSIVMKGKMGLLVIPRRSGTRPIRNRGSQKMAGAAKAAGVNTVYATVPGGTHLPRISRSRPRSSTSSTRRRSIAHHMSGASPQSHPQYGVTQYIYVLHASAW